MTKSGRIHAIDEIRGFCIICMVFYHLCFTLKFSYGVDIPIMFDGWFTAVQQTFAGVFVLISGAVCNLSSGNLRRGALCVFAAAAVSAVTAVAVPHAPVYFGILHCLGAGMLVYGVCGGLLRRLPVIPSAAVCAVLFAATYLVPREGVIGFPLLGAHLPDFLYETTLLMPLGIIPPSVSTIDYFPLVPWLFLFLLGTFAGVPLAASRKTHRMHCPPLAFVGRHSLAVYLAHQPIITAVLWLML